MIYNGTVEGIGVRLRPVEEGDAAFILGLRQDKERTRYVHSVGGDVQGQVDWIRAQREREGDYYFIVEDKSGIPLGTVGYYGLEGKNGELGRMIINGSYIQNCDAILQARRFAFDIIGADHVRCTVVAGNKPVIAQLKRFGGEQVGSFVDEQDGFEVLEYRVEREAYQARKDKLSDLVARGYETQYDSALDGRED